MDGDPDACAECNLIAFDDKRSREALQKSICGTLRVMLRTDAGQEDREFVTTQARQCICSAHPRLKTVRHFAQKQIADTMPEAVIDQFESVEINVKHTNHRFRAGRSSHFVFQLLCKITAIRQRGKSISTGLLSQTRFGIPGDLIATFKL